ncbi:unnamed protein product [Dracunculus medinensis]|uniref:Uncharacterized protein n=1 Tax=Dracunculus medinensis TaxID=318479 RepID=A0A0N4UKI3_DRAME|nr:unnamed protein product [Dracunculus medinensis]
MLISRRLLQMTISVIGPSSSKIILRHLNSNTKSADFDGPQSFHLEHVRKRIEFTNSYASCAFEVPLMFRERLDYTFYTKDLIYENHLFISYVTSFKLYLKIVRLPFQLQFFPIIKFRGLENFTYQMGFISTVGQFLYPHIEMESLSIVPVPNEGTVRLMWRVKYLSWLKIAMNPKLFSAKYRKDKLEWLEGYSIFFVDKDGLVYRLITQRVSKFKIFNIK